MWRDIALANREALLIELMRYEDQLDEMRAALEATASAWKWFSIPPARQTPCRIAPQK